MKRFALKSLWIFSIIACLAVGMAFSAEQIKEVDFNTLSLTKVNDSWQLVEDLWIAPDKLTVWRDEDNVRQIDLSHIKGASGIRGTLHRDLNIPEDAVGKPVVIVNQAFSESFELYVNGVLQKGTSRIIGNQLSLTQYVFVPEDRHLSLLIHFEQSGFEPFQSVQILIGRLETAQTRLFILMSIESSLLALTLVFFIYLIWQRLNNRVKTTGWTLEFLVVVIFIKIAITEVGLFLNLGNVMIDRLLFVFFILLSTFFVSYGFEQIKVMKSFAREISSVYLVLMIAIGGIIPFNWIFSVRVLHLMILALYVILSNRYQLQRFRTSMLIYYIAGEELLWHGILNSSLFMFPVIICLIYSSFSREISTEETLVEVEPLKKDELMMERSDALLEEVVGSMEEGFVIVSEDLYIDHLYSKAFETFFGTNVKHQKITDLLYANDFEDKLYAETILGRYFDAESPQEKKLYLDLLSNQLSINNYQLSIHFEMGKDSKYLIVKMCNKSDYFELKQEMEEQGNLTEMTLEIIKHQAEFRQLSQSYEVFSESEIWKLADSADNASVYVELVLHRLRLYSEQFEQFKLFKTTKRLNNIIAEISELKNTAVFATLENIFKVLKDYKLSAVIAEELEIVEAYLGDDLLKREGLLMIEQEDLVALEQEISKLPDNQSLMERVGRMKQVELQKIVKQMDQRIQEMARKQGKKINPIHMEGHECLFNETAYGGLIKSLYFLIENAIVHGIESPSERFRKNKGEYGTLSLKVEERGDQIELVFEDDGRGIDFNGIKDVLYQNEFVPFETLVLLDLPQLTNYLFSEGVTTEPGHLDGMGLVLYRREVEQLRGTVRVESEVNEYTRVITRIHKKV